MDRRKFLKSLIALPTSIIAINALENLSKGTGLFIPEAYAADARVLTNPNLKASEPFWDLPRSLNVYRPATKEALNVVYWENNKINMDGYSKLCWLMRDVHIDKGAWMDPRVFDLLRAIQAWVSSYGYTKPIQINSGYRSLATNSKLEGAAKNSMHLHGKAIDIVVPGLPSNYVGMLAAHYQAGGVGFYPNKHFVHIDTGRQRYWVGK